jgi:hypothetical protein
MVPGGIQYAGYIPGWLREDDPRPVREQLDSAYAQHGGYWPQEGFTYHPISGAMSYPGDPPFMPCCTIMIRDELVIVYRHGYVAIVQADKSFVIARMD